MKKRRSNRRLTIITVPFILLSILVSANYPLGQCEAGSVPKEYKNRLELSTSYEHVSPNADYGDWKGMSLSLYRKERSDFSWYSQIGSFSRPEGDGQLIGVGAFKDWSDSFYTHTAFSAGTNAEYLPKVRVDHNFNFKLGDTKQYVWSIGGTHIGYAGDRKDVILSTGVTAYLNKTVAEYRIFKNESDPGSVGSYAHLISLAYGQEKDQWTTITYSTGKQAYLATQVAMPQEVNKQSDLIMLNHRRWLGDDHGVFGDISYLDLEESYHKTGFSVGYFREY